MSLTRTPFTTSRLLEFCSIPELTKLVGSGPRDWPLVAVKELVDNGLDACEEAGIAPEISIVISTERSTITITDNGPGIAPETVKSLLDYRVKTSAREAYAAPTRGAQGNALQALLAMPFALDGKQGETDIVARGVAHHISFGIDPVRREPKIDQEQRRSLVQLGTKVTLNWPLSASSKLASVRDEIVQVITAFGWLNPHATFALTWNGKHLLQATDPSWRKWQPSDPAPAAWYDTESFSRLIAACVAHDQDHGRDRTVREFIAEFRGFARSDAQKKVLNASGTTRMSLREFFAEGKQPRRAKRLLALMQNSTKPVLAKDLGLLGKEHFLARFEENDVDADTFQYQRDLCDVEGVPYAIEAAFGYCPDDNTHRRIIGVNWSPTLLDPFRELEHEGGDSLDQILFEQRAGENEPIVLALHVASPCITYTDKAKTAAVLPDEVSAALAAAVQNVTKAWAKQRKAEERDEAAKLRRLDRLSRRRKETQRDVAFEVIPKAYLHASDNGTLPVTATQNMYAARPEIQERTGKQLDRQYFNQTLLPDFLSEHKELTANWDIAYDDRGHFTEPHTGHTIGLGTWSVSDYLDQVHKLKMQAAALAPARIITCGPHGAFGALLYLEKEGFLPLFERVQLASRYDIGILSNKGMSVTAARKLADEICHAYGIPLLVLHDFDKAGFSILATFERRQSRRYTFENKIKVIDLGLRLGDIRGLQREVVFDEGSKEKRAANLQRNGAKPNEVKFLLNSRVELNAMTPRQLVTFVERKLQQHGIGKVVPKSSDLANAYRLFAHGCDAERIIKRELKKLNGAAKVTVPRDLETRVRKHLKQNPTVRWDEAVQRIVAAVRK